MTNKPGDQNALEDLIVGHFDGSLSADQEKELADQLTESTPAKLLFLSHMRMEGRLHSLVRGAYVPGNSTLVYPDGYARLLPKGAKLKFQMHYTPNGTATEDSTQIGLVFSKEPPQHEVKVFGIANKNIKIPPHAEDHRETASRPLPHDVQVLSFLPHMHLRGKAARYDLLPANGTKIETLLDIPRYDFNWQLLYRLAEPRILRKGDKIQFTCWFDNSANNPAISDDDRNKTVKWGPQTKDEMHLGYVEYIVPGAKPGDSIAGMRRTRPEHRESNSVDADTLKIGGQDIKPATLWKTLGQLDKNKDKKLDSAEVPKKHQKFFEFLDTNDDGVLTTNEVSAAIRQSQDR